jgi:predicted RNA binding protein YcfA (HicA-like mRNA interferase family)
MSFKKYPILKYREIRDILEARGFTLDRTEGSHEQWIHSNIHDAKRVVTLDNHGEFYTELMKSMIRQSGLTREEFYCSTKSTAKKINKTIDPSI